MGPLCIPDFTRTFQWASPSMLEPKPYIYQAQPWRAKDLNSLLSQGQHMLPPSQLSIQDNPLNTSLSQKYKTPCLVE
jgi:hypothetical protein